MFRFTIKNNSIIKLIKGFKMDAVIKKNFSFFDQNKDEFQRLYPGKVLLIANCEIQEICNTFQEAYEKALGKYKKGEFVCQTVDYNKPENIVYFPNL